VLGSLGVLRSTNIYKIHINININAFNKSISFYRQELWSIGGLDGLYSRGGHFMEENDGISQ